MKKEEIIYLEFNIYSYTYSDIHCTLKENPDLLLYLKQSGLQKTGCQTIQIKY